MTSSAGSGWAGGRGQAYGKSDRPSSQRSIPRLLLKCSVLRGRQGIVLNHRGGQSCSCPFGLSFSFYFSLIFRFFTIFFFFYWKFCFLSTATCQYLGIHRLESLLLKATLFCEGFWKSLPYDHSGMVLAAFFTGLAVPRTPNKQEKVMNFK